VIGGSDYSSASRDSLKLRYRVHPQDSTLRQILMAWAKAPETIDTLTVTPNGNHREFTTRRHSGWLRQITLSVTPQASRLLVGVYFSAQGFSEPNFIVDSTGKKNVTTNAGLKRRFYRPGADSLTVRVTRGLGHLLNRTSAPSIAPDIYLRNVERSTFDTSTVGGNSYNRVPFPTMGEVGLPRASDGKLRVGLDIYLYPLEGGQ
jgi:hypothetical protein